MRKIYEAIGGSFKGLELLAAATEEAQGRKPLVDEASLLKRLEGVKEELHWPSFFLQILEHLERDWEI